MPFHHNSYVFRISNTEERGESKYDFYKLIISNKVLSIKTLFLKKQYSHIHFTIVMKSFLG